MGVISNVVNSTETILAGFPELVFNAVGPSLEIALKSAGVLSLMFIALNQIFQIKNISFSTYMVWAIRYICILTTATIWLNFKPFYDVIVNVPSEYAGALIGEVESTQRVWYDRNEAKCGRIANKGPLGLITWSTDPASCWVDEPIKVPLTTGSTGTYALIDTFKDRVFTIAGDVIGEFKLSDGGTYKYILAGLILYIIGIIYTAAALVIAIVAKVGLAVTMGLAPLAIAMLTFNQTRSYFEGWLRLTAGFAVVPLLLIAIMSVIVTVGNQTVRGDDFFGGYLPFALVAVAGLVFMFEIPTMAGSLASVTLPQIGTAAVMQAMSRVTQIIKSPLTVTDAIQNRGSAAINETKVASAGGANPVSAAFAGVRAMSQSAEFRAERAKRRSYQEDDLANARSKGNKSDSNAPSSSQSAPAPAGSRATRPGANTSQPPKQGQAPAAASGGNNTPFRTQAEHVGSRASRQGANPSQPPRPVQAPAAANRGSTAPSQSAPAPAGRGSASPSTNRNRPPN